MKSVGMESVFQGLSQETALPRNVLRAVGRMKTLRQVSSKAWDEKKSDHPGSFHIVLPKPDTPTLTYILLLTMFFSNLCSTYENSQDAHCLQPKP